MQKTCKQCSQIFEITHEDLKFYNKVSPVFNGKKYVIPPPTFCPDCRQQRRLAFRNERKLYPDQCDLCKKTIISLYSADKPYKVYCQPCWWGDGWDGTQYGRDFDFNRSFTEQFKELQLAVPRVSIFNLTSTNSEYTNHSANNKNCYMGVAVGKCEDCLYGHWVLNSKDTVDGLYLEYCEQCYECSYCQNCYHTFYSQYSQNLRDCLMCFECKDLEFCIGCVQIQHKKYYILNKQVTEQEFKKVQVEMLSSPQKFQEMRKVFQELLQQAPRRASYQINCYNSTGDDLYNCKNTFHSFNCRGVEDSKYMYDLGHNKDCMDCYEHGWLFPSELNYELHAGMSGYHLLFCNICAESRELLYSDLCFNNSTNLFGCVGLKKKNYCIFNKQYSQKKYEEVVPEIIEHMDTWGEFLSPALSPFGYNETAAQEYFELTKEEALKKGFQWSDYEASKSAVDKTVPAAQLPTNIHDVNDDILDMAIECEISKKPFRIIKKELEFYRKNNLPLPLRHPDERHMARMKLRQPRRLWIRQCIKCNAKIETTYAPDRPEKIYCEKCYLKEVY